MTCGFDRTVKFIATFDWIFFWLAHYSAVISLWSTDRNVGAKKKITSSRWLPLKKKKQTKQKFLSIVVFLKFFGKESNSDRWRGENGHPSPDRKGKSDFLFQSIYCGICQIVKKKRPTVSISPPLSRHLLISLSPSLCSRRRNWILDSYSFRPRQMSRPHFPICCSLDAFGLVRVRTSHQRKEEEEAKKKEIIDERADMFTGCFGATRPQREREIR